VPDQKSPCSAAKNFLRLQPVCDQSTLLGRSQAAAQEHLRTSFATHAHRSPAESCTCRNEDTVAPPPEVEVWAEAELHQSAGTRKPKGWCTTSRATHPRQSSGHTLQRALTPLHHRAALPPTESRSVASSLRNRLPTAIPCDHRSDWPQSRRDAAGTPLRSACAPPNSPPSFPRGPSCCSRSRRRSGHSGTFA